MDIKVETDNDFAEKVTAEEYRIQSQLATQTGLFEAGQQTLLKNQKIEAKERNRKKIINFLNNNSWGKSKRANVFRQYVAFTDEDILELEKKIAQCKEDYNILDDMCEENIKEIDELNDEIDEIKKQTGIRISILRGKCLAKNDRIRNLMIYINIIVWIIALLCIVYNTIGIPMFIGYCKICLFHFGLATKLVILVSYDWFMYWFMYGFYYCFGNR